MNQEKIVQLKQGLTTAFINQNTSSNLAYKPQFVSNNYREGRKVISSIEDELCHAKNLQLALHLLLWEDYTASSDFERTRTTRDIRQNSNNGLLDI